MGARSRQLFGPVLAAGLLHAACSGQVPQASQDQVLRVGLVGRISTVNQLLSTGSENDEALFGLLFDSLARDQPDFLSGPPSYEPRLASSWELAEDRTELTIELRPEAVWSDGEPVTAEDVRFSWLAQRSPEVAWSYQDTAMLIEEVEVLGPHRARFHFVRPSTTALDHALTAVILPGHAWSRLPFDQWQRRPTWFLEHLVTSGPFRLLEWRAPERVVLGANDDYHQPGLPRLRKVVLQFVDTDVTLLRMLQAGELDFVGALRPRDAARVETEPGFDVLDFPTRQFTFLSWNTERGVFDAPRERRALALAVDRQRIVDTLWFGRARVGSSPIPASMWAHHPALEPVPFDPARALELLQASGWRDSDGDGILDRDGLPFRFELITTAGNEVRWDALQMIRADLLRIGVDAEVRRLEGSTATAMLTEHRYDAAVTAFGIDTTLDFRYAFKSGEDQGSYNYGRYSNPRVDQLLDAIAGTSDTSEALPLLLELQEIVAAEQPMMFLWEPSSTVAFREGLENVGSNALSVLYGLERWHWRSSAPPIIESGAPGSRPGGLAQAGSTGPAARSTPTPLD